MRFALIFPLGCGLGAVGAHGLIAFSKWTQEVGVQGWQITLLCIACFAAIGLVFDRLMASSSTRSATK